VLVSEATLNLPGGPTMMQQSGLLLFALEAARGVIHHQCWKWAEQRRQVRRAEQVAQGFPFTGISTFYNSGSHFLPGLQQTDCG